LKEIARMLGDAGDESLAHAEQMLVRGAVCVEADRVEADRVEANPAKVS